MFRKIKANKVDIVSMETPLLNNMENMFTLAEIKELNLKGLQTGKVESMWHTFDYCNIQGPLDLSTLDFSSLESCGGTFFGCEARDIIFNTSDKIKPLSMMEMFNRSSITSKELDISSFIITDETELFEIFHASYLERIYVNKESYEKVKPKATRDNIEVIVKDQ